MWKSPVSLCIHKIARNAFKQSFNEIIFDQKTSNVGDSKA